MVWVEKDKLPRAPKSVRALYEDFAVAKRDEEDGKVRCGCPVSFNRLTVS